MKHVLTKIALVTTMALTSVSANAEFIKGDWKVEGDQLTAVDTQTGIEWLSLEVTQGQSYTYVNYVLASLYPGWRMPTSSEVVEMMDNVMGWNNPAEDVLAYSNGQYQEGISNFRYVFGTLFDARVYGNTFGIHKTDMTSPVYLEDGNRFSMTGVLDRYDSSETDTIYQGYGYSQNSPGGGTSFGVYLVSDGGASLASINNPNINSPVVSDVPLLGGGLASVLLGSLFIGRRRRKIS